MGRMLNFLAVGCAISPSGERFFAKLLGKKLSDRDFRDCSAPWLVCLVPIERFIFDTKKVGEEF
jgi:hypothetical protein